MSNNTTTYTEVPCQQGNGTDAVFSSDNSTEGQPCGPGGHGGGRPANRAPATRTFYMQPFFEDPGGLYLKYDPMIGIRTATILGSCLMILMVYILYKAKCRSNQWTSTDQLYLENYKRRMAARSERKKNNVNYSRLTKDGCLRPDPAAMQATANWIQTQPLQAPMPPGRAHHVAMCNICVQGLSQPKGRECQPDGATATGEEGHTIIKMGGAEHCFQRLPINVPNLPNHNEAPAYADENMLINNDMNWHKEPTGRGRRNRKKSNNIPMEYLNLHLDSLGNSVVAPAQSDPVPYIITRSPSFDDRIIDPDKKVPPSHLCTFCDRDLLCTNHNQNSMGNHFLHIPSIHHSRSAQSSLTQLQMAAELDHSFHNNIKSLNNVDKSTNEKEIMNTFNAYANSLNSINLDDSTKFSPMLVPPAGNLSSPGVPVATRPNSIHLPLNTCPTTKMEIMTKCDSSIPVIGTSDSPCDSILPRLDIVIGADSDQSDQMTDLSVSKDSAGETLSLSDPTQSIFELSGDLDFIDATPPNEEDELEEIEKVLKGV